RPISTCHRLGRRLPLFHRARTASAISRVPPSAGTSRPSSGSRVPIARVAKRRGKEKSTGARSNPDHVPNSHGGWRVRYALYEDSSAVAGSASRSALIVENVANRDFEIRTVHHAGLDFAE